MLRRGKTRYYLHKDSYAVAKEPNKPPYRITGAQFRGLGKELDIHKMIGKLLKPKAGWTPGKYKYMGPYNPLEKQLECDNNTGEVTKWHVQPYNKVDEIAAYYDICYNKVKNKGDCDKQMVESLDHILYGEMPKWCSKKRKKPSSEEEN